MKKIRKGPPAHLTTNSSLKELGEKARADFRQAVESIPKEERAEMKQVLELRLFILQQIEKNGLRRKTIAERMGMREEAVSRLLNHEIFNPTISTLTKLMAAVTDTNMSVTEIFKAGLEKALGEDKPQLVRFEDIAIVSRSKAIKKQESKKSRFGGVYSKSYNSTSVKIHLVK